MSAKYVFIYPTPDYTGANPAYYVSNEERDLVAEGGFHLMLTHSGPFYADTMEVYDADTNTRLIEKDDFTFDVFESDATRKSNKDVFGMVKFNTEKYPTVEDIPKIRLKYQFVGGPFHANIAGLLQAVRDMDTVVPIIYWDNILGKPTTYPPSFHLHKASDITHLDSTNDILRAINVSIQDLADRLVAAKEPKHNVTNAGRVKVALDAGRELNSGMGDTIWLQFPRSENENAQFGFTAEIMTPERSYNFQLLGKEHPTSGFEAGSLSFISDMFEDHPLELIEVSTLLGQSYLQIKPKVAIPGGYYVIKEAVVNYHTPEEWITPIIWQPAVPDVNDPEYLKLTVPPVNRNTLTALENNRDTKRNLNVDYTGELDAAEKLALRFPKGQSLGQKQTLRLSILTDAVYQEHIISCLINLDGTISEVKARSSSAVDTNLLHVESVGYDSANGYVVFKHAKGSLVSVDAVLDVVAVSKNGEELNSGWEFLPAYDDSALTKITVAAEDIVNLQSRHTHEISHVTGLSGQLSTIGNDITTLSNNQTTLSENQTTQGESIDNINTAINDINGRLKYKHTVDMTSLNPLKLYLVELTPVDAIEPNVVSLAVTPNKDTATADHFGFVRGEFQFEDALTRGNYFDYVAVVNDVDVTKLSFDSVWYSKPTHVDHTPKMFFYVKGGESLGILTNVETVQLHTTGTVVIDNDGADVTVATEVDAVPVETASWLKLTDLVGNSKASSF